LPDGTSLAAGVNDGAVLFLDPDADDLAVKFKVHHRKQWIQVGAAAKVTRVAPALVFAGFSLPTCSAKWASMATATTLKILLDTYSQCN
jgi:hypothetical protein